MADTSSILRAAWVPDDDPERDWAVAAGLAVDWIRQECAEQGATGVLVLNAFGVEQQIPALRRFAAEHTITTPRASGERVGRGTGPVFAYVPDAKSLDFAMNLARASSLVVVESAHGFPLKGWARQLGAVDLTRPEGEHADQPGPCGPSSRRPPARPGSSRTRTNGPGGTRRPDRVRPA
ncbi:hypothetical protein OG609_44665 (plasmid) [Streptomyces sp. NBC_01224]|uniref:hypothetical protein n=1 Tax=Streptomyces sp. NBC_01224 TaxID=2903783 RepID=UPI002E1337E7|nr:hypothetical protein OG609_44665 [Streptomyces sp. NBC_01224]